MPARRNRCCWPAQLTDGETEAQTGDVTAGRSAWSSWVRNPSGLPLGFKSIVARFGSCHTVPQITEDSPRDSVGVLVRLFPARRLSQLEWRMEGECGAVSPAQALRPVKPCL